MSGGPFADTALKYHAAGYSPIPIVPGTKRPPMHAWTKYCDAPAEPAQIVEWIKQYKNHNIGIALGTKTNSGNNRNTTRQIIAIDIDDEELVGPTLEAMGRSGPTKKGKKGLTIFALAPVEITNRKFKRSKALKPSIELLAYGSQTVVPPSIHPEGMRYEWWQHSLLDTNIETWPLVTDSVLDEIAAICHGTGEHFNALNTMVWLGVDGGGNTHDICVSATASLVGRGWADSDILDRIQRAKQASVERSGNTYDWPNADETIREWIESARRKGIGEVRVVREKKAPPERLMAEWGLASLGGPEAVRTVSGLLRRYHDGHWPMVDVPALHRAMYAFDPFLKKRDAESAVAILATLTEARDFGRTEGLEPRDDPKRQRICLTNGTLNLRTGQVEPWSSDHEILHQIDVEWDDFAECPLYDYVSKFAFNNDQVAIETWDEYCALTLVDDMTFQKVLFLRGPGGNGKGTLARVLRNLHSPSAIGSVAVTDLNDERKRTSLVGKLVNISGEQSRFNTVADTYLKKITGGDPIDVRRLYGETLNNVSLTVRFVELVNEMPATNDATQALRRRLLLLDCPNKVINPDQDMDRKLLVEKPGILRRYVIALHRLYQRGYFNTSKFSQDEIDAYLTENDPIIYWLVERTQEDKLGTPSRDLWADFNTWQVDMGYPRKVPEVIWGRRLTTLGFPSFSTKLVKGTYVRTRNIKIKPGLEGPI